MLSYNSNNICFKYNAKLTLWITAQIKVIKRVNLLIDVLLNPSFCIWQSFGENPSNWTKIDALIYGNIFKVNKPITKVSSPENVLTKLLVTEWLWI
jgi:hypothetical protein